MEFVNVESDGGTSKNLNLIKRSCFFKYLILSNEKYAINFSKVFENGTPKGLIIKTRVYMKLYTKYNLYQYVINIIM